MKESAGAPSNLNLPTSLLVLGGLATLGIVAQTPVLRLVDRISGPIGRFLVEQLSQPVWHGLNFFAVLAPVFLFVVGGFSLLTVERKAEDGVSTFRLCLHAVATSVILYALGFACTGGFSDFWPDVRLVGFLQRVAVCYLVVTLITATVPVLLQIVVLAGILVGQWALLAFLPEPEYGAAHYEFIGNVAAYVDHLYLPGLKQFGDWDPYGLVSTVGAIATCLVGSLAARWLQSTSLTATDKTLGLLGAGSFGVATGFLLDSWQPINAYLGTPAFALSTAGCTLLALGVLYVVVDVWGIRKWAFPFVVIGANVTLAYVLAQLISFEDLTSRLVGGNVGLLLGSAGAAVLALTQVLLQWLLLYWLFRKGVCYGVDFSNAATLVRTRSMPANRQC